MAEAVAKLRFVRMSPRKTRVVVDLIRGCPVNTALATLKFTPRAAARVVEKVLKSAVANAQQPGKELGDEDALRVSRAVVDVGPTLKRFQPRAQGRAFSIHKRMSHITIAVEPIEVKPKNKPAAKGAAKAKGPARPAATIETPATAKAPARQKRRTKPPIADKPVSKDKA